MVRTEHLALPIPCADPQLHALLRKHADAMLAELPPAETVTERVRKLLTEDLGAGAASLRRIARIMAMSERTLARYLEKEGTTFTLLLEDLRRRMALRYVYESDLSIAEITVLLGFSQSAVFHRAFRRWTGQTPRNARRAAKALVADGEKIIHDGEG